jgi:hypothetical protein
VTVQCFDKVPAQDGGRKPLGRRRGGGYDVAVTSQLLSAILKRKPQEIHASQP